MTHELVGNFDDNPIISFKPLLPDSGPVIVFNKADFIQSCLNPENTEHHLKVLLSFYKELPVKKVKKLNSCLVSLYNRFKLNGMLPDTFSDIMEVVKERRLGAETRSIKPILKYIEQWRRDPPRPVSSVFGSFSFYPTGPSAMIVPISANPQALMTGPVQVSNVQYRSGILRTPSVPPLQDKTGIFYKHCGEPGTLSTEALTKPAMAYTSATPILTAPLCDTNPPNYSTKILKFCLNPDGQGFSGHKSDPRSKIALVLKFNTLRDLAAREKFVRNVTFVVSEDSLKKKWLTPAVKYNESLGTLLVFIDQFVNGAKHILKLSSKVGSISLFIGLTCEVRTVDSTTSSPYQLILADLAKNRVTHEQVVSKFLRQTDKDEEQVQTETLTVSIKCPISCGLIDVPVRGPLCNHLQCFDLLSYLQINCVTKRQNSQFVCPICNVKLPVDDLLIDGFTETILKHCDPDSEGVIVDCETGEFSSIASDEEDDEDEDENGWESKKEDNIQKHKRRRLSEPEDSIIDDFPWEETNSEETDEDWGTHFEIPPRSSLGKRKQLRSSLIQQRKKKKIEQIDLCE